MAVAQEAKLVTAWKSEISNDLTKINIPLSMKTFFAKVLDDITMYDHIFITKMGMTSWYNPPSSLPWNPNEFIEKSVSP